MRRAQNKPIQCFIWTLCLEVEAEAKLNLPRIASAVGSSEERRGHDTAVLAELLVVEKILDVNHKRHRRSALLLSAWPSSWTAWPALVASSSAGPSATLSAARGAPAREAAAALRFNKRIGAAVARRGGLFRTTSEVEGFGEIHVHVEAAGTITYISTYTGRPVVRYGIAVFVQTRRNVVWTA